MIIISQIMYIFSDYILVVHTTRPPTPPPPPPPTSPPPPPPPDEYVPTDTGEVFTEVDIDGDVDTDPDYLG